MLYSFQSTNGGDEEDRTPDPLRARQVLSQLSYTPIIFFSTIYILIYMSNIVNIFRVLILFIELKNSQN